MPELSPAAQAIEYAYFNADGFGYRAGLAAALLAAADQVVPENPCGDDCCITQCEQIRAELLAIAAELEAQ
jgi:hypothetical protein